MATEKRLIDANALIAEYDRVHIGEAGKARQLMQDAPAIDAVEVVRCKDCRHSESCGESRQCLHPYGLNTCDGKDFCSYGERRTDNE